MRCQRGCETACLKRYATAADAQRYAAAFDREDRADLGPRSACSRCACCGRGASADGRVEHAYTPGGRLLAQGPGARGASSKAIVRSSSVPSPPNFVRRSTGRR
jgi:hypothetical protein